MYLQKRFALILYIYHTVSHKRIKNPQTKKSLNTNDNKILLNFLDIIYKHSNTLALSYFAYNFLNVMIYTDRPLINLSIRTFSLQLHLMIFARKFPFLDHFQTIGSFYFPIKKSHKVDSKSS